MKKAKIFLTALTVLAVVSGALAFKVVKHSFIYYTCNTPSHKCEIPYTITTQTTDGGNKLVTYAPLGQECDADGMCRTFITTTD